MVQFFQNEARNAARATHDQMLELANAQAREVALVEKRSEEELVAELGGYHLARDLSGWHSRSAPNTTSECIRPISCKRPKRWSPCWSA